MVKTRSEQSPVSVFHSSRTRTKTLAVFLPVFLSFPTHCQFPFYRIAPPTSSNTEERFNLES